jgi:FKBP-type peptidyl-prolyl cis-trans isomerase
MKLRFYGVALAWTALAAAGCSGGGAAPGGDAALDTDDQKASYGIGLNMGGQLQPAAERIDRAAMMRGIEDALEGNEPAIPQEELQSILMAFGQEIEAAQAAERDSLAEANAVAGEAYLAQNARKEGVTTTDSGLQYEVIEQGDGPRPTRDDRVRVNYRGTLIDGTEFDSSYSRNKPATFRVDRVIPGWTEALKMMKPGAKWQLFIPPGLAYGERGPGPIPPNSTLIFDVELISVGG